MSHKIHHREVGEGSILVLLHGYGGSVLHWDGVVEKLKTQFRVVIPNISHLFLSGDRIFFSIQVELIAKYLREHFPGQKVNLTGTSYGGALAWGVASHFPEQVENLILINPMVPKPLQNFLPTEIRYFSLLPLSEGAIFTLLSTPVGKALLKKLAETFRDERTRGAGRVENLKGRKLAFVTQSVHRFLWILRNEDWQYWQDKILRQKNHCQSLLIYDREDSLFSAETYQQFAQDLGCHHVHEITGAGHLAIKVRPDSIAYLMADYLQSGQNKMPRAA